MEHGQHDFVEPAQAAEAGLLRDLGHRPGGRVEQQAGEMSAARPGDEAGQAAQVGQLLSQQQRPRAAGVCLGYEPP